VQGSGANAHQSWYWSLLSDHIMRAGAKVPSLFPNWLFSCRSFPVTICVPLKRFSVFSGPLYGSCTQSGGGAEKVPSSFARPALSCRPSNGASSAGQPGQAKAIWIAIVHWA